LSANRPPSRLAAAVEARLPGIFREIEADLAGLRTRFPGTVVSSWWRSKSHNERVGGAQGSQHLAGLAVDLVPPRRDWAQAAVWLRSHRWTVIDEGDHLHAQVFRASSRVAAFVKSLSRFA